MGSGAWRSRSDRITLIFAVAARGAMFPLACAVKIQEQLIKTPSKRVRALRIAEMQANLCGRLARLMAQKY